MNQQVTEQGLVRFTKVFNPIVFETETGESLSLTMRDSGYELIYNGELIKLNENKLTTSIEVENNNNIADAMKVVTKAIREDRDYKEGWCANIAMAFQDEFATWVDHLQIKLAYHLDIHRIANNAANDFLDRLIQEPKRSGRITAEDAARAEKILNSFFYAPRSLEKGPGIKPYKEKTLDDINNDRLTEEKPIPEPVSPTKEEFIEEMDKTIESVQHFQNNYCAVGKTLKFKDILPVGALESIALGTFYAGKDRKLTTYTEAAAFKEEFNRLLKEEFNVMNVRDLLERFKIGYDFSDKDIQNMTDYAVNSIQNEFMKRKDETNVREADKDEQNGSSEELPDWFKTIDFDKLFELNHVPEVTQVTFVYDGATTK